MLEKWRLIRHGPARGSWNMAVDEALLLAAEEGGSMPALRLYSWTRPTLSIGRLQKTDRLNFDFLGRQGIPVVRRPTGGRALLHDNEVTYSITLLEGSRLYGSLAEVYSNITAALAQALSGLGVRPDTHANQCSDGYFFSDACFATRLGHEISQGGRKVAAGAQRRMKRSAMQHGSILLTADAERSLECLIWTDARQKNLAAESMAGLWELTGRRVGAAEVAGGFIAALAGLYGIEYEASTLSEDEMESARRLESGAGEPAGHAGAA